MLTAEVLETMLYGSVTWSPGLCHNDALCRPLEPLQGMTWNSIEGTFHTTRILFAGFMGKMLDTRLPKCMMSGDLIEVVVSLGRRDAFSETSELSRLTSG